MRFNKRSSRPHSPLRRLCASLLLTAIALMMSAATAQQADAARAPKKSDTTAPETTITARPATSTTSTSASFSFASTEAGSFDCALDAAAFARCTSPKAYSGLATGSHTFKVRARDSAGNVDSTPATATWVIEGVVNPAPDPVDPAPDPVVDPAVCSIAPADGQVAITAAIASCPDGSTVRFPSQASYTQNGPIIVAGRTNLTIDGNGSTFRSLLVPTTSPTEHRGQWRIKSGTNVTLKNTITVGNFHPTSRQVISGNQFDHSVEVKGGDGVTISDNTLRNAFGDSVMTMRSDGVFGNAMLGVPSRNVRVLRNTIMTMARQCVSFSDVLVGEISDNQMSDCHYGGIDLEPDVGGQKMQDVKVLRNTISGYFMTGIAVEGPMYDAAANVSGNMARIELRGNTIGAGDTCWPAILFSEPDRNRGPISDVTVADNKVAAQGYGIGIFDVNGASVTGNDITVTMNLGWCGTTAAVRVARSTAVSVAGNITHGY